MGETRVNDSPSPGGEGGVRASLPLAFLSLFIRTLSLYPTGQVHFAKSIPLAPDLQGIGSSTVNPFAMRIRCSENGRAPLIRYGQSPVPATVKREYGIDRRKQSKGDRRTCIDGSSLRPVTGKVHVQG